MVYNISYDLNKPGQVYDELYETIEGLGDCIHPLDSTWLVSTSLSAEDIRDRLITVVDKTDALLVNKASVPGAWFNLAPDDTAWLKSKL